MPSASGFGFGGTFTSDVAACFSLSEEQRLAPFVVRVEKESQ